MHLGLVEIKSFINSLDEPTPYKSQQELEKDNQKPLRVTSAIGSRLHKATTIARKIHEATTIEESLRKQTEHNETRRLSCSSDRLSSAERDTVLTLNHEQNRLWEEFMKESEQKKHRRTDLKHEALQKRIHILQQAKDTTINRKTNRKLDRNIKSGKRPKSFASSLKRNLDDFLQN